MAAETAVADLISQWRVARVTAKGIRRYRAAPKSCAHRTPPDAVMGMPFIDHPKGKAYYRHWAAAEPRAVVVFLHGFGEHTGVYHRYGFALNAAGIDLLAVDQFGHGLSPGPRGDFGSIEDSSDLADALSEIAEGERPGLPLVAQGHSFGSVVTLSRLLDQPDRYRAGVISGAPLVPIPEISTPTAHSTSTRSGSPRTRSTWIRSERPAGLRRRRRCAVGPGTRHGLDRFGKDLPGLAVPTLAVHGVADPSADRRGAGLRRADRTAAAQGVPGGRHDILNDTMHREVAAAIVDFVNEQASP